VAFTSDGVVRDDLLRGDDGVLCVADIFRALPNGIGPDHIPGYPLVSFWASGAELRVACEVSVSLSGLAGSDFFVQMSGQRCHYDPTVMAMIRTDAVYLGNEITGYSPTPIDISGTDTALYRIAVDLYVAELMSLISEYTYGALTVTPKNADGTPVTDMLSMLVDADPVAAGVQELKLWQALLRYLSMLPDTDADTIPNIPAGYATPFGRYYHD